LEPAFLDKAIGIIDLVSSQIAAGYCKMDTYPYFIEFYLSGASLGDKIISEILPSASTLIIVQGIPVWSRFCP